MECLSPEQVAAYLRGRGDAKLVESHVRDCPKCAFDLLLSRETLSEFRDKVSRPATDRLRIPRRQKSSWIPWTAAAAVVLVAIAAFALRTPAPPRQDGPSAVRPKPPPIVPKTEVAVAPEKPVEVPKKPEVTPPLPPPPKPETKPEVPLPKPEPPVKPPEPPKPEPSPTKPAPTLVERAVVAKVTHTVGGTALGRTLLAGDTIATGRQEFVTLSLDGYGSLYFRENSKAEIGAQGEINLVDGEMMAHIDGGRRLGALKTPVAEVEVQAAMFDVQVTKTQTEISVVEGRAAIGSVTTKGPSALVAKAGKAAELRPLDPGFVTWIPDKLAAKRFSGWIEGETFTALQGFKAMEFDGASGRRAVVQTAEQGTAGLKSPFPFRGRHALWLRVRTYEAKATTIGLHVNGQSLGEVKVDAEAKPWRWIGPLVVTSDRLDLVVAALSRSPLSATNERNSFPVALDAVWVTTDLKATPDKLGEERRAFDLVLDEPVK